MISNYTNFYYAFKKYILYYRGYFKFLHIAILNKPQKCINFKINNIFLQMELNDLIDIIAAISKDKII